jgi:hypothetical protein
MAIKIMDNYFKSNTKPEIQTDGKVSAAQHAISLRSIDS